MLLLADLNYLNQPKVLPGPNMSFSYSLLNIYIEDYLTAVNKTANFHAGTNNGVAAGEHKTLLCAVFMIAGEKRVSWMSNNMSQSNSQENVFPAAIPIFAVS